ncbi:MAG: hypothetical protein Q7U77_05740 [Sediminibacterium sp.]|uniref:hypothetical protein n=1 Tax=Sediminibacterium sp. TaxID=1917865 RepID=UPI002725E1C2|nr:hypothetical protein [Sediminibacterium sp.]MDO8996108.1 hypothetical protein [Sediminibacterium sp.]
MANHIIEELSHTSGSDQQIEDSYSEEGTELSFDWEWCSKFRLICLIGEHGKNWGAIHVIMDREHKFPNTMKPEKLRIQFNSLNSPASVMRKPFKKAKFKKPSEKDLTKVQIAKLSKAHDREEEEREKQHKQAQKLLDQIAADEIKASKGHGVKRTISDVNE